MSFDTAHKTEAPAKTVSIERDAQDQLIDDLMDKVDGLMSELDSAVSVAISCGALTWARLNYPNHADLKPEESEDLSRAEAAGLSALKSLLSEHELAVRAANNHLMNGPAEGIFDDMDLDEIDDFRAFHARAALHMRSYISSFATTDQDKILRDIALTERAACMKAVSIAWAPVVGTPYITGPRKFCDAIRDMPDVDQTSVIPTLKGKS